MTKENYPDLSEDITVKVNADRLEALMDEYISKDPNDKYAVMKAVFYCNQREYMLFIGVRLISKLLEIFRGLLYLEIIKQFELFVGPFAPEQYWYPICLGIAHVALENLISIWWGYFDF